MTSRKIAVLVLPLLGMVWSVSLVTAQRQPLPPVSLKLLRDNVYSAPGGTVGNSGVIVGKTGVIVIDAKQTADAAKALLAEIAKVTPKPVTHVILTGSGGENSPGIVGFPAGLTIIGHEKTKKALEANLAAGRPAPPADRMPNQILTQPRQTLTIDGVRLELLQLAPAHFDGDVVVYLPDQRIVFTGYLIQPAPAFPVIHIERGGSAAGWIGFTKAILALDADTYIVGQGEMTKAEIQQKLAAQEKVQATVNEMVAQGKTQEEIRTALGTAPGPGGREPAIYVFSEVAYQEAVKKAAK